MSGSDQRRHEEALDWVCRIHDPSFTDWDGHLFWLEADPRNSVAFDEASILVEEATSGLTAKPLAMTVRGPATNDNMDPDGSTEHRLIPRWGAAAFGGAIAAGLAAIIAIPAIIGSGAQPYRIDTLPGTAREVALQDGTTIAINGGSSVELDRANPRVATVVRGEAFFRVVHDAAHPFAVRAGDGLFQDVGTSFDVVRDASGVHVAVREGAIMYDPKGAAVRLTGGQEIALNQAGAKVAQVDPASVGGWRHGRLAYADATLGSIAADLTRSLGDPVTVDPALKDRHFSGVIMLDKDRNRMFRRMASVMDVTIRHSGTGWQMTPHVP